MALGPFGLGWTWAAAGFWGGAVGGAISGGLEGGWRGALMGGLMGGALGGLGGWAYGGGHSLVLAGMFVGGVGYTAATDSWDSFAGGLAGAITGGAVGKGITGAYKQQFANFRAGDGFRSNADVAAQQSQAKITDALTVKPFGRAVGVPGAEHTGWATEDGTPLVEMGPEKGTGKIQMNRYESLSDFRKGIGANAQGTWKGTLNAFNNGDIIYGASRVVSRQAFFDAISTYGTNFINTGRYYNPVFENSNFAADWIGNHSGVGPASGVGWAPGGFSFPWDN